MGRVFGYVGFRFLGFGVVELYGSGLCGFRFRAVGFQGFGLQSLGLKENFGGAGF